ncbi:DUF3187 family protein [Geothrix edaphica]|uniref:DUF3187 family protein n=1 Tax=Geothrix edaphica TaxID=2927976 RepID=A0ABQ5PUJ4_9BACT|nr:DUF3187 family protein [Geothrix edaphica]GLH65968.1 hypothetical protein GETHED_03320 [Geothrix edaphica]
MIRSSAAGLILALALPLVAKPEEAWPDPGPPSSRDLFPLNLVPLTYWPVGAQTVGQGRWRFSFQVTRSNTFEFSDLIKERLRRDASGRFTVDRAGAEAFAASLADEPLIYYFDAEVQRTELSFRYGLSPETDLALTLGWQSVDGGFMDGLIEGVHRLGFEQAGREAIARDQVTSVIIQNGQVVFFSQTAIRLHPVDPVVAVIHRLHESPGLTVSFLGALQVPATRFAGQFRSDWDSSAGLGFQWRPAGNLVVNGGAAYLRRGLKGGAAPNPFLIKDQIAGHLGWEWRGWTRVRPFLVLLYHDALTSQGPGATLDKPSVIHDVGVHVRLGPRTALTFSYINNITNHENTADMGLALRLAVRP